MVVYLPILDSIISEMEWKFYSTEFGVLQSCNSHSAHFVEVSEITEKSSFHSFKTNHSNECAKSTLKGKDHD